MFLTHPRYLILTPVKKRTQDALETVSANTKEASRPREFASTSRAGKGEASLILTRYREAGGRLPRQVSSNGYDLSPSVTPEAAACELMLVFEAAFAYSITKKECGKLEQN